MAETTKIEWCDSTWNPWIGCTQVSPACDHCYAAVSRAATALGVEWGAGKPRHRTSAANWKLPLRWNSERFHECTVCGWRGTTKYGDPVCCDVPAKPARRRVFCSSLADVLDYEVPIEWFVDCLDLCRRTPNIDKLLLTKRIGNWRRRLGDAADAVGYSDENIALRDWIGDWLSGKAPTDIWLGATICNQAEADRDVPKLLRVPAAVRFLSIEPMLGRVDLCEQLGMWWNQTMGCWESTGQQINVAPDGRPRIGWVICGGESGAHARPMHPDWARSLRDQCAAAGVPFLFKQHGEWLATAFCDDDAAMLPSRRTVYVSQDGSYVPLGAAVNFFGGAEETAWVGKKAAGRKMDGRIHHEFPRIAT